MKSWAKFTFTPWLFIILITAISISLSKFSTDSIIISILFLIFIIVVLVALPYTMLLTAPKNPYILTVIYMLFIWGLLKLSNLENFSMNTNTFNSLLSGLVTTSIAMGIFYFKSKKKK